MRLGWEKLNECKDVSEEYLEGLKKLMLGLDKEQSRTQCLSLPGSFKTAGLLNSNSCSAALEQSLDRSPGS